jgi:hypothetical protein
VDSVNLSQGIRDSFGVSLRTCEDHREFASKSLESVVADMKGGEQETRRASVCGREGKNRIARSDEGRGQKGTRALMLLYTKYEAVSYV